MYLKVFIVIAIVFAILFLGYILFKRKGRGSKKDNISEIDSHEIKTLVSYISMQKEQREQENRLKELKKAEMKQKLEVFKQTKHQLKDKLKSQLDKKSWKPLNLILNSSDKGGVGIYILHNKSKNKYYVGQAKQIFKRIRQHFDIEDIAMDYLKGDLIEIKYLTANELDSDYRLDHIEKTAIEAFDSDKSGYNKTTGNL